MNEEQTLKQAGVRVTAVRLLVWRTILKEYAGVFSLADLEDKLPTVDKSTLFRTLTLLSDNHLLDTIDDGSGSQKYCLRSVDDPLSTTSHSTDDLIDMSRSVVVMVRVFPSASRSTF